MMEKGIDYYPEHWDQKLIEEDLKRFQSWGINTIRIGEFAWHLVEKTEGNFDFSFFDNVISLARKYNFKIMYGIPTATFPAWLAKKDPSILLKHQDYVNYGGRREYCYNSKTYQIASKNMIKALVSHYKDYQEIIAWQLDNEVGHEGSDFCCCDNCKIAYQEYLKDKYHSIDALNEAWGNIFWGHTYNAFDEIDLPIKTITYFNPSQSLDFYRFRSLSAANYINMLAKEVRKYCGKWQLITHDFPGNPFSKLYDHNLIAKEMDFVSYNNYPVWGGLEKPITPAAIALQLDFFRGLKQKNFTITEQLIGAQGHQYLGYLPRPNQSYLWSMQALAHGCDNLYYFRERSMNKGQEQFCYGVLGHDNKDNRRVTELKKFFSDADKQLEMINSPYKADVAIVYDFDNIHSWRIQPQSTSFDFLNEFQKLYDPLFNLNVNIDVVAIDKDLSPYKIIIFPVFQFVDDELIKRLEALSKQEKTIIFSFRSGFRDKDNNLYFGMTPPCKLSSMLGVEVVEVEALPSNTSVEIINDDNDRHYVTTWRDMTTLTTAKSLYKYNDEFNQYHCVSLNKYNSSDFFYFASSLPVELSEKIITTILKKHNIDFIKTPKDLEIVHKGNKKLLLNHSNQTINFDNQELLPYSVTII